MKFLDESGVTTQMTRLWGRAPRGERIREAAPDGRWQVLTTLGTMSLRGMEAVMTIPAATDGDVFHAYVEQVLCPKLRSGDVLVMDNLSAHKVAGIRKLIEARERAIDLSAALLAGPEPHRERMVQVQTVPPCRQSPHRRSAR